MLLAITCRLVKVQLYFKRGRVIVNRFWKQLFGKGIVETVEDLGSQGIESTHPELLDWLSVKFMEDDQWRVKKLLKTIVMPGTYRQSSKTNK